MARPIWSGSISFGLVQIPVGVTSAEITSETHISFSLLDDRDMSPIGYKQINKSTGEEVPKEHRAKGYEVEKGEFVLMNDDDFKRANVKATETIDIHSFVELSKIPILRYEKPYYLEPQKKGLKAYALLRDALDNTGKVAVATMVMRGRQYLCAVIPYDGALVLEMLRYDHELRAPDIGALPKVTAAEIKMAETLVEGMTQETFDTSDIKDTYRDDLMKLIEERRAHPEAKPAKIPKTRAKATGPTDIMELLKASVAKHKGAANEDVEEEAEEAAPRKKARRKAAHRKASGSSRAKRKHA